MSGPTAALVRSATAGDPRAWNELVATFDGRLRAVARGFRLQPADVEDVVQNTWLRAYRSAHQLHEPGSMSAWLIVTARREALRVLQRGVREVVADIAPSERADDADAPEPATLAAERDSALHAAVGDLPPRQARVLVAMLASPGTSYRQLADRLDMPIGSIGPTRERALARLRDDPRLA